MRRMKGDIVAYERVGRMVTRMDITQKRLVFGLAFQGWEIGDWIELMEDLPSGWEFAA